MKYKTNKTKILVVISILILLLAVYIVKEQKQGREEITKVTEDYIASLLPQVREAGVIEIKILSSDIKVRIIRATAKLDIVFRVYNPSTQQVREDKDTVTFYLKKSGGDWKISDAKYEKTRW